MAYLDSNAFYVYNKAYSTTSTEYSQALPNGCSQFMVRKRTTAATIRMYFTTTTATPSTYWTLAGTMGVNAAQYVSPQGLNLDEKSIYFWTDAAATVEIIAYT